MAKMHYPLPNPIDNGDSVCVKINVPNVPEHRRAFIGAMKSLSDWFSWARDSQHKGKDAASIWRPIVDSVISQLAGESNCEDCEDNPCKDYKPEHPIIEYWPNDPFRTPDFTPENYTFPPWYHNASIALPGVLPGDAMVNGFSIGYDPLQAFQIFLNLIQLLAGDVGFPSATVHCFGTGQVEIELVKIIQGGLGLVLQDNDMETLRIVSLNAQNLQDLDIELILELLSAGDTGETVNTEIIECNFDTEGEHTVTVIFVPNIGTDIVFGFGGGIRRITLCGLSVLGSEEMFRLRQNEENNCLLEQSLDNGQTWLTAFDYGLCNNEPIEYRYTQQPDGTLLLEESTDGGLTWFESAPPKDMRHKSGVLLPLSGNAKCAGASSAVAVLQDEVATTTEYLTNSATASAIAAGIIAFLALVGIATGGLLTAIAAALATALVNVGASEFAAAFTPQVWSNLQCHLFHNVSASGGFSIDAWNKVKEDLSNDISGIAKDHLWKVIDLMGSSGLTNAARMGLDSGLDCDECETCTTYQVTTEPITISTMLGVEYRIAFSGTLQVTSGADNWGDAWGFYVATYAPTPRRQNDQNEYICITIDDEPIDLEYNAIHDYNTILLGTGENIVVKFQDNYPSDNSGYITMTICHNS